MLTTRQKVHGIIHIHAAASAAVGAASRSCPAPMRPVLCGIQTTMIMAIASERGVTLPVAAAQAHPAVQRDLRRPWLQPVGDRLDPGLG